MSIFDTDIQPIQQDPEFDRLRGLAESIKAESGPIGGTPVEPTIDINAYLEGQLSASLYDAALVSPAEYAEKARLGKAIDVDPDIIGPSNIDFAKQEKLVNSIDVPRLLKEYPVTSAFLVNNANVAQTSVNKMTALEQILGIPSFIGRSGLAGVYGLGGGLWGAAHGVLQNVNAYGAKPLYEAFTGRPGKEEDAITSWLGQQAEDGKQLFHETLPKENTAVAMGLASTTMFFGSLLASFGNPMTALKIMSASAGGSAYEDAQEADRSPFQSVVHGATQGGWEYLTENTPLTRLFKDLKIGAPLWNMILHQFKLELIGESLATLAGSFTDWAGINNDHSFESFTGWLKGLPEEERQTAISTFVSVGTTTTLMHGVQKVINKGLKVQHAKDMGQVNDVVQNMIKNTDMATVAPEAMSDFLNQLSKNNPEMSNVYIDPVRLTEALSTSGSNIDDIVEIYPDIKKQMKEDPLGVNDISIPAGTYHAMIAPKFGSVLNEHVKYGVDQLSLFELPEAEQEQARLMEEAGVALDAKTEERKAFQASAAEVKTLATEQIKEATKGLKISAEQRSSTIAAIQQMTVTAARRLGVTPMEAYERVVSKIVSGESLEEGALEQPGTLTKRAWLEVAPDPDDKVRAPKWESMTDDQRLSVSRHMSTKYANLVADLLGSNVRVQEHTGSFEGKTNYSYTVKATKGDIAKVGDLLGYVFAQKGMVVLSDKPFRGSFKSQAVYVEVGERTLEELHDIYTTITGLEGVPPIQGQTTLGTDMVILLDDGVDPKGMEDAIKAAFNNKYEVSHGEINAKFPGKEEYNYTSKKVKLDGDQEKDRRRYRHLRAQFLREYDALVEETIRPSGKFTPVEDVSSVRNAFERAGEKVHRTNREFKVEMQKRVNAAAKAQGIDLTNFTPEVEQYLVRMGIEDALTALEEGTTAVGWYNKKVTQALEVVARIHPEVAKSPESRFAFTWALAVTSNGLNVKQNFFLAEKCYEYYKENGKMPEDLGEGTAAGEINRGMHTFNYLVERDGLQATMRFMTTMTTVREVKAYTMKDVSGEAINTRVYGAACVGAKIGNGFFANLYGDYAQLTMDRWFMRTWGRWTGTLVNLDNKVSVQKGRVRLKSAILRMTSEQKKAFKDATGVKLTVGNLDALAFDIAGASTTADTRAAMAQIPHGDEIRKAGNNLAKNIDGQKEAPANATERKQIRKVMRQVLAHLQITYPELTMADMQALLWYPEKKLYDSAKTEETSKGYDDDEAPDYANAAIALAKEKGVSDEAIKGAIDNANASILRSDEHSARVRGTELEQPVPGESARISSKPQRARALPFLRSYVQEITAEYGEPQPGAISVYGIHFSERSRDALSGDKYGTGLKGAEARRVSRSTDNNIKQRIHFYVDEGQSIVPENGVGYHVHGIKLNNIYDYREDPLNFGTIFGSEKDDKGKPLYSEDELQNMIESAVVAAGFDGIYMPAAQGAQGVAVVLGDHTVNPTKLGLAYEVWNRVEKQTLNQEAPMDKTIMIDGVQRSTVNSEGKYIADTEEGIRNFWAWFGNSVVVDGKGNPLVVYHGSEVAGFSTFNTEGTGKTKGTGAFFSSSLLRAKTYSGSDYEHRPLSIDTILENPEGYGFEFEEDESGMLSAYSPFGHRYEGTSQRAVLEAMDEDSELRELEWGNYSTYLKLENPAVIEGEGAGWQDIGGLTTDQLTKDTRVTKDILGEDGVIFKNIVDEGPYSRGYEIEGDTYVVFDPTQIKSVYNGGAFDPKNANIYKQERRGSWNPSTLEMRLYEGADFTTIMHEFSHGFMSMYMKAAEDRDVSPQITEDVQTLLDWFGVKDLTEWNRMSLEEQAPFHEQFAYNWEKYLFGGKAPSTKLQKIYDKFTKWVKDMYNGYVQQLNTTYKNLYGKDLPGMTPEVKGVFDRMLASEAQIDQVMQAEEMKAAFGVKPDGMTDAQWAEYEDMLQEVRDEAVHKLTAAALRELKWLGNAQGRVLRELQGQAKKARDKVKKEVTEDIENRPVYVLARFLKTGVLSFHGKDIAIMPGGGMGPGVSAKISLSAVKGMFPPGKVSQDVNPMKLGTGKNGMLANDGMLPEQIAEAFRTAFPEEPMFTSGEGLVHALLGMVPIKQAIESETDQRMLQEHSELLDKDSLDLKVREALHSTLLSKMNAIELKFMSGTLRPVRILTLAARAVAKQMLSKVKVSQLNPRQHAVMANRAGKSARKLFIQKDYQGAARTKQAQLLQNEMMKEALEMRKEISSFLKSVDKYQKTEISKKVGDKATEQIRSILYRFGLTSIAPTVAEEEARRELVQHLMSIEEAGYLGYSSTVPAFIQKETVRIPYSELSIDQMRELIYTIQSLEKIGRAEIADRDATTLGSIANNVALAKQSIEEKVHDPKPYHAEREGALAHGTKSFMWYNMSLASIVRILDGDVDNGPLFRMLMTPANEAGDMETRMRAEAGAALEEIFKKVYGQQLFKNPFAKNKIFIEELKGVPGFPDGMISRPGLVMIAANCGNMDNINRLLAGTGLDQKTLLKVLGNLTKDEANMVQEIWNYYETFRPLIAEQSRKRIGREPKWTVAVPITINTVDGPVDLAGGHFPIRYDNSGVTPASADVDTEGAFGDPMVEVRRQVVTSHGFDMERSKEGLGKPLLLDPSTIFLGINEVIHDLSWRDVLIQSNKIINNTTFKNTVVNAYGANMHNQMTQWIHDVAIGNQVMTSEASNFYQTVSHNISFSRMALSMTTLVKQPLGLIQSMPALGDGDTKRGAGRLMQGLIQYMADPVAAHRVISEGSDFMKYRGSTLIRDLNELRNVLHGESGFMKTLKVNGFVLIAKAQSIVDAITWIAAYNKNAAVYGAKQAGQVADQVVKSAQGSGLLHDMPASMRSEGGMRLFTAFYSYRNATFQRLMVSAKTKGVLSGSFATEAVTLLIVQVLAEGLLMEILSGDDDDDENALVRAGKKLPADVAAYSLGLLPVFGEVTALGQTLFGAEGEYTPSYTGPSRLAMFSDLISTSTQLRQGEFDRALRKGLINLAGDAYGLPSSQINRTWDGIEAWLNDDIESAYDVPTAILFGPRR